MQQLSCIAGMIGATLQGEDKSICGVNTLETAGPEDISFLANPRYRHLLSKTKAGAVLVRPEYAAEVSCALITENPYVDFAKVMSLFAPKQGSFQGTSPLASIDSSAVLGEGCTIYPFAFIGPRAVLGKGCTVFPSSYIGEDCVLGEGCTLYPGTVLMSSTVLGAGCILQPGAVLGSDGFGFVRSPQGIQKIPQVGTVCLGTGVEVGANTTIDRAALAATYVGDNSCLDNLVQIGHNVVLGKESLIIAQVGIAGSVVIGDRVTVAGQVGIAGHLHLGNDVTVGPQSGVNRNIENGATVGGTPAVDQRTFMRTLALMPQFPDIFKRLSKLEKSLDQLQEQSKD